MALRKTLTAIVLAAAVAVTTASCGNGQEGAGAKMIYDAAPHSAIAEAAEKDRNNVDSSNRLYYRAIFNAAMDIYSRNNNLLQEMNIPYSSNITAITDLRSTAEDRWGRGASWAGRTYGKAIYQLEQRILEQQALLGQR